MKEKLPNTNAVIALGIISICTCFMYGVIDLTCGIISFVLAKRALGFSKSLPRHMMKTLITPEKLVEFVLL